MLRTAPLDPPEPPLFVPTVEEILDETDDGNGLHRWVVEAQRQGGCVEIQVPTDQFRYALEEAYDPWNRDWPENVQIDHDDLELD